MELYDFFFQIHKYKNGHQRVSSNVELERTDQDTIDRLSDLSGQIRPGELFDSYYTCYPLPSEKLFVVARTWQDLEASRAGCVMTKSIIIPMDIWERLENVSYIFQVLQNEQNDLKFPVANSHLNKTCTPVAEGPLEELVEALFLEQRKPILIFDASHKVEIISRLYSVFWPGLRRNFSTCTFALATRTLKNKTFDLLFTSGNLRTRFSEWNGRRIEGSNLSKKIARHRWTEDLVDQIFLSETPSLFKTNEEYPFDFDIKGDESVLRLNLLWRELVQKAVFEASPMALLGLLDIINSRKVGSKLLYDRLEPQIQKAIEVAYRNLEPLDAWKFYGALLVKHRRNLMGRSLLSDVHLACQRLSVKNPKTALEFISNFNPSLQAIPAVLYSSIGDGIALNLSKLLLDEISSDLGLLFLATSKKFASSVMVLAQNDEKIVLKIIDYLNAGSEKSLRRSKNNLLLYIEEESHCQIFSQILHGSNLDDYKRIISYAINNFAKNNSFFDAIIFEETLQLSTFDYLYEILMTACKYDDILIKTLQNKTALLREFVFDSSVDQNVKGKILSHIVREEGFALFKQLAEDSVFSHQVLKILKEDNKVKKEILLQFAFKAELQALEVLSIVNSCSASVVNNVDNKILFPLLANVLNEVDNLSIAMNVINKFNINKTDLFIRYIFDGDRERESALIYFETLFTSELPIKKALIKNADLISIRLSYNLPNEISDYLLNLWIELLSLSNRDKKNLVAISMLQYSYRTAIKDPGILICEAFPIVYRIFSKSKSVGQLLTLWIFPDWDKCKTLRHDLVDRYINSNWPKTGLFVTAERSGIRKEIFSILNERKGGKKFINEATNEIKQSKSATEKSKTKANRQK